MPPNRPCAYHLPQLLGTRGTSYGLIAYPNGFTTQFRYGRRCVDVGVWNLYKICKLENRAVLISFLDREGSNGKNESVPCRPAMIKHAEVESTTLTLSLKEVVYDKNVEEFPRRLLFNSPVSLEGGLISS